MIVDVGRAKFGRVMLSPSDLGPLPTQRHEPNIERAGTSLALVVKAPTVYIIRNSEKNQRKNSGPLNTSVHSSLLPLKNSPFCTGQIYVLRIGKNGFSREIIANYCPLRTVY